MPQGSDVYSGSGCSLDLSRLVYRLRDTVAALMDSGSRPYMTVVVRLVVRLDVLLKAFELNGCRSAAIVLSFGKRTHREFLCLVFGSLDSRWESSRLVPGLV